MVKAIKRQTIIEAPSLIHCVQEKNGINENPNLGNNWKS